MIKMDALTGKTLLLFSGLLLSCCVAAGPEQTVVKVKDCRNASTQLEIDQCRDKGLAQAKHAFSSQYLQLKNTYQNTEPKLVALFENMVEGWKQVMQTNCEFEVYYSRGGVGYHAEISMCLEREYLSYHKQLKQIEATP